jgi:hypothetical protein
MDAFAYTSFKHQAQRDLLDLFRRAVLALKLDAQGSADRPQEVSIDEVDSRRAQLIQFLDGLDLRVRALAAITRGVDVTADVPVSEAALVDVADRFMRLRPDVTDRLSELARVRGRLFGSDHLRPQDFRVLDRLQTLLEEEAAEGSRGLYRL